MTQKWDGAPSPEEFEQDSRNEFFQQILALHDMNQTDPTFGGIRLEEALREYAALKDEYLARTKNNTDGKETEFIEELDGKLETLAESIESLQVEHAEELDVNDPSKSAPGPDSFTHPGNSTLN